MLTINKTKYFQAEIEATEDTTQGVNYDEDDSSSCEIVNISKVSNAHITSII